MKSFATFHPRLRRPPVALPGAERTCTVRMTIDAASVTTLRQLAMRVCGDALEFMRIAVCAGGARIAVWLCVRSPFAALLSDTIVRQLPGVQFQAERAPDGIAS